jgi:hypothetical protein
VAKTAIATNGSIQLAEEVIDLQRIAREEITVRVIGTAPLIVHRFDEKARQEMLDKGTTQAKAKKPPRDPQAAFEASFYRLPDGRYGFPAVGFKAAIVDAARHFPNSGLTMVALKVAIFVVGEGPDSLVPILGAEPTRRDDYVRINNGLSTDLRFRGQFMPWHADLKIRYLPTLLSRRSVVALVDAAGFGGIGEWRPASKMSKTGSYGTFQVDSDAS